MSYMLPRARTYCAANAEAELLRRITGKTPATVMPLYQSVYTGSGTPGDGDLVRNPNCWLYQGGVDCTGISPWQSHNQNQFNLTAITPRHVIIALHVNGGIAPGFDVAFVGSDGHVVVRTTVERVYVGAGGTDDDIAVYSLDSDLPSTVTPIEICPDVPLLSQYMGYITEEVFLANFYSHFWYHPPAVYTNQFSQACIGSLWAQLHFHNSPFEDYYVATAPGDSGCPIMFLLNGRLVLYSLIHYELMLTLGGEPHLHRAAIQAAVGEDYAVYLNGADFAADEAALKARPVIMVAA